VSLREPSPYALALEGRAGDGAEIVLNGAEIGRVLLDAGGRGELPIAQSDILAGINQIVLRGSEGRRLSLSRITLTRPGGPE
jgi:hypothetical protein